MAIKLSTLVRNTRLNNVHTYIKGVTGTTQLQIYTGGAPANANVAATGTLICDISLPTDFLAAASNGAIAKTGNWTANASAAGTAGYFRIVTKSGATITPHLQGTIGTSGADLIFNSTAVAVGQAITINAFTITDGNG